MNILKTLSVEVDGIMETINFGIPITTEEMDKMFALRYTEYEKRRYIDPDKYNKNQEKDEYDDKSVYFVAIWKNKMIATIRLIRNIVLPTEKDFQFDEPSSISDISRDKRAELGRFIIIPLDRENKKFLPRGLVMVVMFEVLSEFCRKNGILGGYSFIKMNLYKKMKKLRMPIDVIQPYKQTYPKDGVLYNYFSQKENPVIPIVFRLDKFQKYFRKILSFKLVFENENDHIVMKNNLFTKFLKYLKII
jgi:N-acyl-L-homoserine lactone synthetase